MEEDADQIMNLVEDISYRGRNPVVTLECIPKSKEVKLYYANLLENPEVIPYKVEFFYIFTPDWRNFDILGMRFYDRNGRLIESVEYDELAFRPLSVNPKVTNLTHIARGLAKN